MATGTKDGFRFLTYTCHSCNKEARAWEGSEAAKNGACPRCYGAYLNGLKSRT